jgi:hypothetical protein
MGYFSTPIAVKPLPGLDAVRISVRASESRVDEWTVLRPDVESVLDGYEDEFNGWRGVGELRVRMGRSGGDVAFYNGDDRALLRLSAPETASFMAHLRSSLYELDPDLVVRLEPRSPPRAEPPPQQQAAPQIAASDLESIRGMLQQVMLAVITLTSDVNRMMQRQAERDAERAALPAPAPQVIQVVQPVAPVVASVAAPLIPQDAEMFIPSMGTSELAGAGLEAKEKSGSGSDLAEAAAALKAAKKRRTTKKKEES